MRLQLVAKASYSWRKSSRGSPTFPEKRGALLSRADGIAEGPVGGLAAIVRYETIGGIGGCAGTFTVGDMTEVEVICAGVEVEAEDDGVACD